MSSPSQDLLLQEECQRPGLTMLLLMVATIALNLGLGVGTDNDSLRHAHRHDLASSSACKVRTMSTDDNGPAIP